jgi:hypothetical protein
MGRQTPVLLVSGGYEFLPETGKEQPAAKMKALSQAYADLKWTWGRFCPARARHASGRGGPAPTMGPRWQP